MAGGGTYQVSARWQGLENILGGFGRIGSAAGRTGQQMVQAAHQAEREWNRLDSTFSKVFHGVERVSRTGRELKGVWREGIEDVRRFTEEYMKLAQAQTRFKLMGLSGEDNARAFDAVRKSVDRIKGTRLDEVTENITDLYSAFNNLEESIEFLDKAGKISFSMQTLFEGKFSPEQTTKNIQEMFKALEMMGAIIATGPKDAKGHFTFTDQDKKKADSYLDTVMKIVSSFGSRVTPSDIFAFSKTARASAAGLSERGLVNTSSVMYEQGASQTGTALQTLQQQIIGGKMQKNAVAAFAALGMLKKKIEFGGRGKGHPGIASKILAGAVEGGDELKRDPMEFADLVLKRIEERNVRISKGQKLGKDDPFENRKIDTHNASELQKALMILFPVRTAQGMMSLLMTQRTRILGHTERTQHAAGVDEAYGLALDSPMGKMRQFEAAIANFKANAGKPMLEALTSLTQALAPVINWFAKHETITKWTGILIIATKAVAMFAKSWAVLKVAGFFNLFGGKGAAGIRALQMSLPLSGNVMPGQAGPGATAGRSLATGIITGVGIGLAGLALESIISEHLKNKELAREAEEAGKWLAERHNRGFQGSIIGKSKEEAIAMIEAQRAEDAAKSGQAMATNLRLGEGRTNMGWMSRPSDMILALRASQTGLAGAGQYGTAMKSRAFGMLRDEGGGMTQGDVESEKAAAVRAVKVMIERFGTPESFAEYVALMNNAKEQLKKAGEEDLFGPFKSVLDSVVPTFAGQFAELKAQNDKLVEAAGYDAQTLQRHAEAVDAATNRLNGTGQPGGTTGTPAPPPKKKRAGGLVLHPTNAVIGDAGPEWVTPFHETIAALRNQSIGGVSLQAPINQHFHGPVTPEMTQAARRQTDWAVRHAGEDIIRAIEKRTRDVMLAG